MRIVVVTESFAPATDAAAESARHVADALLAAGHDVLVFTTGPGSESYRGARVQRARALFSVTALRHTVTEFQPDVVQFLAPRAMGAAAMRALEHAGVPLVVLDPTPLHPRVGTVLASSHAGVRILGTAGIRARVWKPGVRTDEYHPGLRSVPLHDAWARAGRPEGPLVTVGYVGPVGPTTTRACRRLAQVAGLDGVRLVVLGRGPGTAHLRQHGAKIVGESTGLEQARAIASLDLLVQPRKHEVNLTSVRKALASGVPVVTFETGAAAEVVRHGENGVLVSPADGPAGLTLAVASLAADAAERARLAANARESVSGRTWGDAVSELVEIYAGCTRSLTPVAG
jgi:glycosyltransferase involved in cell wall biosynthesis